MTSELRRKFVETYGRQFEEYRRRFNRLLKMQWQPRSTSSPIESACSYSLINDGKRFRPCLVYLVSESLGGSGKLADQMAFAVEYFHTASLIADDLPCMDDDDERRGVSTTHRVYGEATALLASYALIAEGYKCLTDLPTSAVALAVGWTSKCTGLDGAVGGQQLDLCPQNTNLTTYLEVADKKTAALFQLAFVLGFLAAGVETSQVALIGDAGKAFGRAFQIADDLSDAEEDLKAERVMNIVAIQGREGAQKLLRETLSDYYSALNHVNIQSDLLRAIPQFLLREGR